MDPFDKAIAAIELRDPKEKLVYQDYADFFDVSRTTLAQRHQGRRGTQTAKIFNQTKLTPQQEEELVRYIGDLTGRDLPPTNTMIRNFASMLADTRVSEAFPNTVTRTLSSQNGAAPWTLHATKLTHTSNTSSTLNSCTAR